MRLMKGKSELCNLLNPTPLDLTDMQVFPVFPLQVSFRSNSLDVSRSHRTKLSHHHLFFGFILFNLKKHYN